MTFEQLKHIAECSFPDRVKQFIDFDNLEMHVMGNVYRLYDKNTPFLFMLPSEYYLSIHIEGRFVQIIPEGSRAFDHYKAISIMKLMNLIAEHES